MRIVIVALALTLLAFLGGVVGDFSGEAPYRGPVARVTIPPDAVRAHPLPPLRTSVAQAETRAERNAAPRSHRVAQRRRHTRLVRMIAPAEKPVRMVSETLKIDPSIANKHPSKRELAYASM